MDDRGVSDHLPLRGQQHVPLVLLERAHQLGPPRPVHVGGDGPPVLATLTHGTVSSFVRLETVAQESSATNRATYRTVTVSYPVTTPSKSRSTRLS